MLHAKLGSLLQHLGTIPWLPSDVSSPPSWCFWKTRPQIGPSSSLSLTPCLFLRPSRYSEVYHHGSGVLGTQGWECCHHATEVHKDTAMGQEPMEGQEGQRDDVGGGICQLALQATGRRFAGRVQGLLYLTSLSLAFFPLVGNSPPLGAQKLWTPLPEARCPQGRRSGRSGMVLSLP